MVTPPGPCTNCVSTKNSGIIIEPRHETSNNVLCASSKPSGQPAHTRNLIRVTLLEITCRGSFISDLKSPLSSSA